MNAPPPRQDFTAKEWRLIQNLKTPAKVQRWLTLMPYNWERQGGTMRSFREVVKRNEAHCLEACVSAAVILEQPGDLVAAERARIAALVTKMDERAVFGLPAVEPDLRSHPQRP